MSKQIKKHKSRRFRRFARANEAVSALEYAILVGVIAVGMGAAILAFEDQLDGAIEQIGADVANIDTQGGAQIGNAATN